MAFPTYPGYVVLGVAVPATITAYNAATTDFTFTSGGTAYNANWNAHVLANQINTIGRVVGSSGRLNLTLAKATVLRLSGDRSAGANCGGTDYHTYSRYTATVRSVSGTSVVLTIGGHNYTVDWANPAVIWTGAETTITPTTGSTGTVRIGDGFGRTAGLGGPDKWPDYLARGAYTALRVMRVGTSGEVVVLDKRDAPIVDSRGSVVTWQLPDGVPGVQGFDAASPLPQIVHVGHVLKAKLGLP